MKTLILGGVRSGKSRLGERLATESGLSVICIVTATANDQEMRQRIAAHRARRPLGWSVVEEPLQLATVLENQAASDRCLLVDCLTLWLSNLLATDDLGRLEQERTALLQTLSRQSGQIILVSNETNMGVTPMGELSRRYCDEAGRLHQELARICDRVILTIAGLPHVLKGDPV